MTGVVLIVAGLVPVTSAFAEFVKAEGTLIPAAPTERLVVTGFNRYVRNPMYVGLPPAILGQALLFGNFRLLIDAAAAFVHRYEEPTLARAGSVPNTSSTGCVPGHPVRPSAHTRDQAICHPKGARDAPVRPARPVRPDVTDPLLGRLAPWCPGFGVIYHRGRRSCREYHNPICVFRRRGAHTRSRRAHPRQGHRIPVPVARA
ncbi:methyltransferase family protein [Sciscionella marina]|uniref:methyltransferase family protein n=1 Tax=Sciscionella marina TaxID=508770 RepID=UPI000685FC3A|nr:methyltransferase [Sciscionella marina]